MADEAITYSITEAGTYRITFETPYFYGDVVEFDSLNGAGEGPIIDIVLSDNGSVSYTVDLGDGTAQGGIYPDEIIHAHGKLQEGVSPASHIRELGGQCR